MGTSRHDPPALHLQGERLRGALFRFGVLSSSGPLLLWIGGYFTGTIATGFMAALFANWLALRIYEDRHLKRRRPVAQPGFGDNLLFGLAGGVGSACLVLAPPLLVGAATIVQHAAEQPSPAP